MRLLRMLLAWVGWTPWDKTATREPWPEAPIRRPERLVAGGTIARAP